MTTRELEDKLIDMLDDDDCYEPGLIGPSALKQAEKLAPFIQSERQQAVEELSKEIKSLLPPMPPTEDWHEYWYPDEIKDRQNDIFNIMAVLDKAEGKDA